MQAGGFFSAEDADSLPSTESTRKREGAFYLWRFEEVEMYLSQSLEGNPRYRLCDLFSYHYNLRKEGNVESSDVSTFFTNFFFPVLLSFLSVSVTDRQ